jgi:short subunit dehydrogenase-like uncharacterized protein
LLLKKIERTDGPPENTRLTSKSYLKGKAWNNKTVVESTMETPNGYTLTAKSGVSIAKKIIEGNFKSGFQTPSRAYGADLILEFDRVKRVDLNS